MVAGRCLCLGGGREWRWGREAGAQGGGGGGVGGGGG